MRCLKWAAKASGVELGRGGGGEGGNLKGEEVVGTRGQTEGSSALWVGKRVGSQDSRRAACTVLLQSTALHSITVGAWDLREGTNKWMGMVFVSPPTLTPASPTRKTSMPTRVLAPSQEGYGYRVLGSLSLGLCLEKADT